MRHTRLGVGALVVGILGATATSACTVPAGRTPVVLVHGYLMEPESWAPALAQLELAGYQPTEVRAIDYDYNVSVTRSAKTLAAAVDQIRAQTGAPKVDIVSHSLGSLVTKQCIIADGCAGKVSHWMSISGVDNGTDVELVKPPLYSESNEDVQGRTPVIRNLQANWGKLVEQGVQVRVQWTPKDEIVQPPERSKQPAPATDRRVDNTTFVHHLSIINNTDVVNDTVTFFGY